jgi:signal transduction histidine kinase
LNHLAEGVAVFGADKRLVFHNNAFEALWGLEPSFLADRPSHAAWLDHLKEKRKLPAHANYAEWRAGELALYQEVAELPEGLWVLPDGRVLRIARQRHPGGGLLLVFSDITNELTLRSQYNALLQTQKAALDKLHEAVVVFGLDGRLKLSNAAFAAMWKLDPESIEQDHPFDRVVEACEPLFHDRAVWAQVRARITDPSPEARTEYRGEMRRSDHTVLKFLTRPLPDGATLVAFQDISADRRIEEALRDRAEALEAADKLKTQFVENVSYQLRNPLQVVHGNAEMLQLKLFGPLNDRQVEHVGSILDASGSLIKLIENILDVAMVEAGNVQLDLGPVDVFETLGESVQMAASKARDTEVPIKIVCDPKIGLIEGDSKRLKQVIVNLLANSLRHTERGDSIICGAERLDGVVRIYVQDTGKGMAFDAQARAFDSFESGDRRGAGLGLALVRSFIEMHRGWVAMSSEPGRGTTVSCHLPASAPVTGPPPTPPDPKKRAA